MLYIYVCISNAENSDNSIALNQVGGSPSRLTDTIYDR